ncbi:hypothetical protein [uncultured Winogradskyella sp.]|uniref:hypothetical protein n=1 Tax=uncultured Winogradskyella sp. TaxID=395353 RepID=UPI002622AB74|nr:hypothetical protein [uncultured Winogradskyella sp.]
MVLNDIEKLLEKYNNAETSLAEEAQLRAYFKGEDVAPHLEHYKSMFVYFSQSQQEQYTKDVSLKTKNTKVYQWISVAAVTVLMLGFIVPKVLGPTDKELKQQQDALIAYNQTMDAFKLVSIGMNEGKQQLNSLAMMSNNLNHGIDEAGRLSEFSETTNKIFKTRKK